MIITEGIHYSYDPEKALLRDVSFTIRPGSIVAITGENGAGKSTLIKLLYGELAPLAGTIHKMHYPGPLIEAFVDQDPANCIWPELTVHTHLLISLGGTKWFQSTQMRIHKTRIHTFAESYLPELIDHLESEAGCLSRGQMQLLSLAMAVARAPQIIYLDEISASLSLENQKRAWTLIADYHKRTGATVLFVSHTPDEVRSMANVRLHLASQTARLSVV